MRHLDVIVVCGVLSLSACTATSSPPTSISDMVSKLPPTAAVTSTVDPAMEETEGAARVATLRAGKTATSIFWESVTPTLVPEFTPTPASAGPALQTGQPYLIFRAYDGDAFRLWMVYADGSGLQQIVNDAILEFVVAPSGSLSQGARVAYLTEKVQEDSSSPIVLKILNLPDRTVQTVMSIDRPEHPVAGITDPYVYGNALAWSHDGMKVAFPAALDDSVNIMVYSLDTRQAHNVTTTEKMVAEPRWSPDDAYVIYGSFDAYYSDALGASTFRSVKADGSEAPKELIPEDFNWIEGWLDNHTVIIRSIPVKSGFESRLVLANVATGDVRQVRQSEQPIEGYYTRYQPYVRAFLSGDCETYDQCESTEWLFYFLDAPNPETVFSDWVAWIGDRQVFAVNVDGPDDFFITPGGSQTPFTAPGELVIPYPSDDGQLWAWYCAGVGQGSCSEGLWITDAMLVFQQVTDAPIQNLLWVPNSHSLMYLSNSMLILASAPDFDPVEIDGGWESMIKNRWEAVWIR